MYRLIRNTHLALGVGFTLVWLMYGLSSVQMAHPGWFPMEPRRAEVRATVDPAAGTSAPALAAQLRAAGHVRGDIRDARVNGDTLAFRVLRPGTVHDVTWIRGSDTAFVATSVGTFMGMLNRLHHYGGFWHDWLPLDLWGLLVALASIALLLLGATGIYLWFRTHGERRTGGALLSFSLAFGIVLIALLRAAG